MPKRKRTSSSLEEDGDESGTSEASSAAPAAGATPTSSRKRRRAGAVSQEQLKQVLDAVLNHKRPDGSYMSETFHRLPKRRTNPEYYEAVQNPIDFAKIQVSLNQHLYDDMPQLAADIELLVENARQFYPRASSEYREAMELWSVFNEQRSSLSGDEAQPERPDEKPDKLTLRLGRMHRRGSEAAPLTGDEESEAGSSAAPISEVSNWSPGVAGRRWRLPLKAYRHGVVYTYTARRWHGPMLRASWPAHLFPPQSQELEDALEEMFTSIAKATDTDGRQMSTWFQLVPHRTKLPQYYDVIKQPMDLKTVAQRIQGGDYSSLQDMETDLVLVFKNACTFNEPGSLIYKDSKTLRKLVQARRAEIEHARLTATKSSERIRCKRLGGAACLSAEFAQLTYDEDEEESSSDSNMSEDNPLWQLFDNVRSYTTPAGYVLSEPFQTLPSRRLFPDYYEEIKNPIALRQIKRKMKAGEYTGVHDMEDDMNVMFENAKQYNPPDSKLYKDAQRLQKVVQKKVLELAADDEEGEEEGSDEDSQSPPPRRASYSRGRDHPVKERCKKLFRAVRDFTNGEGRQLSAVFMQLPSRKEYPDYYEIIDSPIDLARIEHKIRIDQYDTETEILQDFRLMFNNCRQYNEEGSVIYDDANQLERVLMSRVRELGPLAAHDGVRNKPRVLSRAQLLEKMRTLFNTIRDHKDSGGRALSTIFAKLPSKLEYPDYFEVIKQPIHMERISQKLKTGTYNTIDEMVTDLVLMFDNACKYNEPDSQIYKDALTLHRLVLQTKLQLTQDMDESPDVKTLVQDLLTSLFIATYNHQDSDGRCYSDSLADLPEHDEVEGNSRVRALSLDIVKRRLDRGAYARLDAFQRDMFTVLERARRLSRPDSQTFEDATEMQLFFISYRDELCQSGTLLSSPALQVSQEDVRAQVATIKPEVKQEDGDSMEAKAAPAGLGDAMSFNQVQYRTGEFVYVEPKDKASQKHIVNIERLWTNNEGMPMMYGSWLFRPEETCHLSTRKFLEKEVFKTDQHLGCPLSQIVGKCCVLPLKDYLTMRSQNFSEPDTYVCESRYSMRSKCFKKIKIFPFTVPADQLVARDTVIDPRSARVLSVFQKRVEKHKEELAEIEEVEKAAAQPQPVSHRPPILSTPLCCSPLRSTPRRSTPLCCSPLRSTPRRSTPLHSTLYYNVVIDNPEAMDGNTYYEQLNADSLLLKTGDCVYIRPETGKQLIVQVDTMWSTPDGAQYCHGPAYLPAADVASSPQQQFYKQEVFSTLASDTHPLALVAGKCSVLDYNDYCAMRHTEISETDVYLCESLFDETKRQVLVRSGELKRPQHSEHVLPDELYHFRRLLVPRKVGLQQIQEEVTERVRPTFSETVGVSSPAGSKLGDEDSLDGPPASVGSADTAPGSCTPAYSKKTGKRFKTLTGYILFSADIRKTISNNNPLANFGDISRLVGTEWKNLTQAEKTSYEERAARMNADSMAIQRSEAAAGSETPTRPPPNGASLTGPDVVYDCCWQSCDAQFEDMVDLIDHNNQEGVGHVHTYANSVGSEYQCQWRGCNRIKKGAVPFPNVGRLARHVKEVHIQRNNGRVLASHERSRNYYPRKSSGTPSAAGGGSRAPSVVEAAAGAAGTAAAPPPPAPVQEPRFVTVPARPQRLLHSEAYIRYIETLQPENMSVGGWERQLRAAPETSTETSRLPTHWLSDRLTSDPSTVVKTLHHLRDYLLMDALGISRVYDGRL